MSAVLGGYVLSSFDKPRPRFLLRRASSPPGSATRWSFGGVVKGSAFRVCSGSCGRRRRLALPLVDGCLIRLPRLSSLGFVICVVPDLWSVVAVVSMFLGLGRLFPSARSVSALVALEVSLLGGACGFLSVAVWWRVGSGFGAWRYPVLLTVLSSMASACCWFQGFLYYLPSLPEVRLSSSPMETTVS